MKCIYIVIFYFSSVVESRIDSDFRLNSHNGSTMQYGIRWCKGLRFVEESKRKDVVALVSYPGSGNSWFRRLLQQATGYYTGSRHVDVGLTQTGLLSNHTEGVLVVKQHYPPQGRDVGGRPNTKCVMLIRNPRDSILAHYNYKVAGHLGTAQEYLFKEPEWMDFVDDEISRWTQLYLQTLQWKEGPVHIVFFELLMRDTMDTLAAVLDFLKQDYTLADLQCANAYAHKKQFQRKATYTSNPFSKLQEDFLNPYADIVLEEIDKYQTSHAVHGWI